MSDIPFRNPGWAGNTGDFDLTEADNQRFWDSGQSTAREFFEE